MDRALREQGSGLNCCRVIEKRLDIRGALGMR